MPSTAKIGNSALDVFPMCLGGNVFGWTADEAQSFAVLDAYAAAGGNFIDTADLYSAWVPGHSGGESEAIIGRWMAARRNRHRIVIATKVGMLAGLNGLGAQTIRAAAEASLRRLGTDRIDLYYAHRDDPATPIEETLRAFDALVRDGKVRYIAASNFNAERLSQSLETSKREGLARYIALQPHYNLVHRQEYEGALAEVCTREGLACFPYFSLASGFLTGKYGSGRAISSARGEAALKYLDDRGKRVLAVLRAVASAHRTTVAAVSLAWLRTRAAVIAPIASARTPQQLAELLPLAEIQLPGDELDQLTSASA
ncbi:MAG: aldo/keto reductase [Polyangiaceae bacterium]|jgi:aryl-alcohol dehydrogenase-like predicted oxidoreductase